MLEARKTQPLQRSVRTADQRRKPQAQAQVIDESIMFDGGAGAIIMLILRNMLLSILTLGLYTVWARVALRRHFLNQSLFLGSRFEYEGDGATLSTGYTACIFVIGAFIAACVLVWQNPAMYLALPVPPVAALVAITTACLVALLCAVHSTAFFISRYSLSQTAWRGFSLQQAGSAIEYLGRAVPLSLLVIATFGLAYPVMRNHLQGYKINHMRLGKERVRYHGNLDPLLRCWLLPWAVGVALVVSLALATEGRVEFLESAKSIEDGKLPFHAWKLFTGEKTWMVLSGIVLFALVMYWYRATEALHFTSNVSLGRLRLVSRLTHADILIALLNSVVLVAILGSVSIAAFLGAGTVIVKFMSGTPMAGPALGVLILLSLAIIAQLLASVRWFILHNLLAGASHNGLTVKGQIALDRLVLTQAAPAKRRNAAAPVATPARPRRTRSNG